MTLGLDNSFCQERYRYSEMGLFGRLKSMVLEHLTGGSTRLDRRQFNLQIEKDEACLSEYLNANNPIKEVKKNDTRTK